MGRPRFEKPYLITEWDGVELVPFYAPRTSPTPIPTPGIFDEPIVCLMINDRWAAHFKGVIDALDQPDTWIGTPEEIEAARQQIREALARFSGECMVCCDEEIALLEEIKVLNQTIVNNQLTVITNNELTIWNQIVQQNQQAIINNQNIAYYNSLYYDGTPESVAPGVPDTTWGSDSSDTTPEAEQARNAALCLAVQRYVDYMIMGYTTSINAAAQLAAETTAAAATVVIGATGGAAAPFIAAWGLILGAAVGIPLLVWNAAANNPEARRKVNCCMYDSLKDSAVSEASFKGSVNDCGFDPTSAEGRLAGLINNCNQDIANYLAFMRMVAQASEPTGTTQQCECGCEVDEINLIPINDCVVTKIDATHWRVQQSNFTVVDIPFAGVTQVYVANLRDEFYRCVVFTGATQAQHDYFVTDCDNNDQTGTGGGGGELIRFGWNYWTPDATPTPLDTILTIECPA